jgi:hypothetical protein
MASLFLGLTLAVLTVFGVLQQRLARRYRLSPPTRP